MLRDTSSTSDHDIGMKGESAQTGFTLVELLIVITLVAVLATIVLAKTKDMWRRATESRLRGWMSVNRAAIERFKVDCGCAPSSLADSRRQTAPSTCLDSSGASRTLPAGCWQGPYMTSYPMTDREPSLRSITDTYEVTPPNVGSFRYNTSILDSQGQNIGAW